MSHDHSTCSDHCHHHGHHNVGEGGRRPLVLALLIISAFAVVEIIGGVVSGSLALLADAGHMVTDAGALALALSAQWMAAREPCDRYQFGLKRAQVLAAFINALGLLAIVGFLVFEAAQRFGQPPEIDAGLMLGVAVVGLIANIAAFRILHPNAMAGDVNIRGAMLHVAADIFGSAAAIISAFVIMATQFVMIDAVLTVLVCLLILRSAIPLLIETGSILLQAAPKNLSPQAVKDALVTATPVVDVHRVRAWQLTPTEPMLSLHAVVPAYTATDKALVQIQEVLHDRFGVEEATVQLEVLDEVVSLKPASSAE
ncbi:MAG: cation diffusion facilitator family transporter [Pseudomonadota bacterium]